MSDRFTVRELGGDPPLVEKRGDPAALDREAGALRLLDGWPRAPRPVRHAPGVLVSTRLPGAPRPLAGAGAADLGRLGALLAELHGMRAAREGGLPWWPRPARSAAEYRAMRADDAERALGGTAWEGLGRRVAAGPAAGDGEGDHARPFRMLHGDLVAANVVWGPDGPGLVDWEFWRMGDPAEELAYLAEINGLDDADLAAVLAGYGDPAMGRRVSAWRALAAADAGAWYLAAGVPDEAARLLNRAATLLAAPG
ncbi:aminoglycoside phosphotransferase family protein [Miltoncostaea marina]|uniref:phosphotransferase n=1 Tax=Miltoncostaea marina TaxID=2843215 RepID=UPI001C3E010A|nr:aminoglycoside phosphotransferase family protein [Miltoncostaea marina]